MRVLPATGCCVVAALLVLPRMAIAEHPSRSLPTAGQGRASAPLSEGSAEVHHYEYVFQPGQMSVFDIDHEQKLVRHVSGLPDTDGVRGAFVDPGTHTLYISHGGDGSSAGNGSLLAYDLVSETVLWNRAYAFGVDSGAITPDGAKIYMPTGENDPSGVWNVLNASDGAPIGSVQGGANAHNTIVSLDGRYAFLGGRNSEYLEVASTTTDKVVQRIGPLNYGVRPFTVNGAGTLAYTTATHYLGFQVSSVASGKVLYTVPIPGFTLPSEYSGPPSHGIALSPDEKRLYVMDAPNDYVHVFDVSGVPASAPTLIASIALSSRAGEESPCPYDCGKSGWLQPSRDGRFLFVGDTGDVIDTQTLKILTTLAPLAQTRQLLEIDWAGGVPIASTTRYGLGYVTAEDPTGEAPSEEGPKGEGPKGEVPPEGEVPPGKGPSAGGSPSEKSSGSASSQEGAASSLTSPGPGVGLSPAAGAPRPPAVPAVLGGVPSITALSISPSAFREPRRGGARATVSYRDSLAALSTFTLLERVPGTVSSGRPCHTPEPGARGRTRRCWRYSAIGHLQRQDLAGVNRLAISHWLAERGMASASYLLRVVPRFAGRAGAARTVSFRILP